MTPIAISARHLYKRFARRGHYHALRARFERAALAPVRGGAKGSTHAPNAPLWALHDVSFEIARGECVALIGHNGAGKSVLLRSLALVTRPTRGEADLYGRVGAVLDVGVGFHRELTGRENIFLQGAILGIKKRELALQLDEIVAFSGMQEFIEQPLKSYSNGMMVRLAFAIAAQLEPEILLMDEVLAVADEDFIRVCIRRLEELKREGRTIILASHDLSLLAQVCTRALWLERGELVGDGAIEEIAARYHARVSGAERG
jgi:ABC-type polysaccharide/polyol phosphate transport system ATPase subunit